MAEAKDPYAAWRKSLRDTLKWFAGALVALGTLLAGGINIGILPKLNGADLWLAVTLTTVAVGLLLYGISLVFQTLKLRPFARRNLENPEVRTRLLPFLDTLIGSDEKGGSDVVIKSTAGALAEADRFKPLDDLLEQTRKALTDESVSEDQFRKLDGQVMDIASFAAAQSLEKEVQKVTRDLLFIFAFVAAIVTGLTVFAHTRSIKTVETIPVQFSPGASGWSEYAAVMSDACVTDSEALAAKGTANQPFDGWWTITLEGPTCEGVTLAVPNAVVQASSSASQ